MPWQKIDDQFGVSQKVIRIPRKRRQQVVGLWTLAGNYAVRALTDGVLEAHELDELDAKDADVDELVRVGLWHRHGHTCEKCDPCPVGGVIIHDFLTYNPSRDSVAAEREAKQTAGGEGNHQRWHVQRRITVAGCEWCESQKVSQVRSQTDRSRESLANPPVPSRPSPVPSPSDDVTYLPESSPVGDVVAARTDEAGLLTMKAQLVGVKNLEQVRSVLLSVVNPLSPNAALELVQAITSRAKGPVRNVDAYIATACRTNADDVRWDYERLDLGVVA